MRYVADKIIAAGDLSGNLTSDVIDVRLQYGFSVFAAWTGTPTGTLKLQASPDGVNQWADVPSVSVAPAGGSSSWFTNQQWQFYPYIRFVYLRTAGTGSLDLWFTGKGG